MPEWLLRMLDANSTADRVAHAFPHSKAMKACPQDTLYHAEGDVWTHTSMVVGKLLEAPRFSKLEGIRRDALLLAAWLHDIAKPATTIREWDDNEHRERVRQPNHAPIGAGMAWRSLIDAGASPSLAGAVHSLVFWHQRPFHMFEQKNMLRRAIAFSCEQFWGDLLDLARADTSGRIAPNIADSLDTLMLLEDWLDEEGLLDRQWAFASEEARVGFLRKPDRSPWFAPPAARGSRVIILSGLPGAGKDTYADATFAALPIVSLDRWRENLGVAPEDNQGKVVQKAFDEARSFLRTGEDFVWNATSVTRRVRQKIVGLCLDYDARVEIHCITVPLRVALERNASRERPVPEGVVRRLADAREPPGLDEAHSIVHVGPGLVPVEPFPLAEGRGERGVDGGMPVP